MNTIRTQAAIGFLVVALSVACGSKPNAPTDTNVRTDGGNLNRFFTVVSNQEIKAANGARFKEVVGSDGRVTGITVVALDNEQGPTLPCVCRPGCGGSCITKGFGSSASCNGSCGSSEQLGCGSCYFELPDGTPVDNPDARTHFNINSNKPPVLKDQ